MLAGPLLERELAVDATGRYDQMWDLVSARLTTGVFAVFLM